MSRKTVFISYSHDSSRHDQRVLELSERLRKDGIKTLLDRYVEGAPPRGWASWMLDQIDAANFVLVVCTETYYRRFRGHEEPDKGKGADWEGALITQEMYNSRSRTLKFIPVLFSAADERFIPEPLRSTTHYLLTSESSYRSLYDVLLGQAGVEPGAIGKIKSRPRLKGKPTTFSEESEAPGSATEAKPERPNAERSPNSGRPPVNAVALHRRAQRYLKDDDYEAALDALNQSIETDPTSAVAFYDRGLAHYLLGDNDLALTDFDRSLELGFDDVILYRNRANAYWGKKDAVRALADYARAIELEPGNPLAYINRGRLFEETSQKELAKGDYQTVLTLACAEEHLDYARRRLAAMGVTVSVPSPALDVWRRKLDFLQVEEARTSDVDQKFSIQQRIEEARQKIRELGG